VTPQNLLFSEEFLRQLEHLAVVTRRPAAGHLRGHHRSRRTGTGMVFTDYRPYSPGDDTRNLDWGTYMRLDRLILRLFEEEADMPIYLFVDVSRSMGFGGKFDFARRFAAALAYIGLINHDRVSVVGFADGVLEEMPARRGKNQVWRMLGAPACRPLSGASLVPHADAGWWWCCPTSSTARDSIPPFRSSAGSATRSLRCTWSVPRSANPRSATR